MATLRKGRTTNGEDYQLSVTARELEALAAVLQVAGDDPAPYHAASILDLEKAISPEVERLRT